MRLARHLSRALPCALMSMTLAGGSALADFHPSVTVVQLKGSGTLVLRDLAARGAAVGAAVEIGTGTDRTLLLRMSADAGATWSTDDVVAEPSAGAISSSSVFVCNGAVFAPYIVAPTSAPTERHIRALFARLDGTISGETHVRDGGIASRPVGACIPGGEYAMAFFRKTSGGTWKARLIVRPADSGADSDQDIDLGPGTPSRGIGITATSSRVFVTFFRGRELRVHRFRIGTGARHTLSSISARTVATLTNGALPKVGADGTRVVLAYMDKADLKVRRSTDTGSSFGSARTLRNEPFPSEIGAFPTSVTVKGSRVAIGAVEEGGIETVTGRGLGYSSTDGGATYRKLSSRSAGRTVATLVKVGSGYRYAEARDDTFTSPASPRVTFRRQ